MAQDLQRFRASRAVIRHGIPESHRLTVTAELISGGPYRKVLELGAGDFSFQDLVRCQPETWLKADFAPPCDVVCELNGEDAILPFQSGSLDLVICTEVLEHLLWPQQVVAEAIRVLRPGGDLLVSVPNIASLSYRLSWLLGRIPSCASSANLPRDMGSTAYEDGEGRLRGGHVVDFNRARITNLLGRAGFRVVKVKGAGLFWYRQVLPAWCVPASLASNIIILARKPEQSPRAVR